MSSLGFLPELLAAFNDGVDRLNRPWNKPKVGVMPTARRQLGGIVITQLLGVHSING